MDSELLDLSISNGLAKIVLNRPEKLNALNCALAEALLTAVNKIAREPSVKAVVVSGAGRAFMAGGDVKHFHDAGDKAPEAVQELIVPFHQAIRGLRELAPPVIAAVHGAVAGGGVALALACDFVIASSDAVFTPAYLKLGTNPDGGTTWSVARLIGERRALEWLLLGEPMTAQQASNLGLINRVVASEDLNAEVETLAKRLCAGPAFAQASLKRLVWRAKHVSLENQLDEEANGFVSLASTSDFREGVVAFFERRAPRFGKQ